MSRDEVPLSLLEQFSPLDGLKRENLKAVVFVQERASRRVLGAAQISMMKWPARNP